MYEIIKGLEISLCTLESCT